MSSPVSVSTPGVQRSESIHSIMQDVRDEMRTLQRNNAAGLLPLPQHHQCSMVEETSSSLWSRFHKVPNAIHNLSSKVPWSPRRSEESLSPHSRKSRMDRDGRTPKTPAPSTSRSEPSSSVSAHGHKLSAYSLTPPKEKWEDPKQPHWTIPFRLAVICPTFAMIFVSSVAFVALALFSHQAQESTLSEWHTSNSETLSKWRSAVVAAQNFAVKEQAILVERSIFVDFVEPPDRAVDTLLGALRTKNLKDGWDFAGNGKGAQEEAVQLRDLEARAWEALSNQWNCQIQFAGSEMCAGRTDSLYATLHSGGLGGAAFAQFDGRLQPRLLGKVSDGVLNIWQADNLTGAREGMAVSREGDDPRQDPSFRVQANWSTGARQKAWTQLYLLKPWVIEPGEVTKKNPNYYREELGVGNWGGLCECPNGQLYQVGDNDDRCKSLACIGGISRRCSPTGIASQNAGKKVTCNAFNSTFAPTPVLSLSRTAPISFEGDFDGVVASDVSLQSVSRTLWEQWTELKRNLIVDWGFEINPSTSSIFVVQQLSPLFPEQVGTLISTSEPGWFDTYGDKLVPAKASALPIVANVSRAILAKYNNSWDSDGLLDASDEVFYFSLAGIGEGKFLSCDPLESTAQYNLTDCVQVGTHSMSLDQSVRWLIVVALPSEAYFTTYNVQVSETTAGILDAQVRANATLNATNVVCIGIIACATLIALLVASVTSCLVLRPLSRLGILMERLSHLDFSHETAEYMMLQRGVRGRVREVNVLREGFCRLSQSIETFAKFVPETVVRALVCDDEARRRRAAHLHVDRRNVTIMFSDVADFTTISEALPQKQLLFLLTLYLTVMTRIVESFEGVVGEVLGDGLLCFWNTPDSVADHATKACMAALAQQKALGPLNAELVKRGLPQLQIRIGLHTGDVFTGNIGSEQKMKFGCMGDPVNLASRLEGLCKVYGAGIMFSGATREGISEVFGFVSRRLDLVQVKGKHEPTEVFELIGCDRPWPTWDIETCTSSQIREALLYEEALDAYQKANFSEAISLAESLLKLQPDDTASKRLLERAQHYVGSVPEGGSKDPLSEHLAKWTGVEKMIDK